MSKELEALEKIKKFVVHRTYKVKFDNNEEKKYVFETINDLKPKDIECVENALKDYEWLKSIIPIDAMFMWNLSADDKLRLLKIMGVKYE